MTTRNPSDRSHSGPLHSPTLSIAPWKYNKDWVYSITYDEALVELNKYVIPHHLEFGIPGHVEVVAGYMGVMRALGESSFNGLYHRSGEELKELMAMGWGVGCHSWSHGIVMDDPDLELRKARETIEDAIGRPVTIFTAPGSNANLTDEVLAKLPEYGYLGGFSISDNINYPDPDDLLWLNRVTLHELFSSTFHSVYDPHKRIQQAQEHHGWIADYCHCPLPTPLHLYKDCTAEHHRERFATITAAGKADCWYANPDDVVDYRYMRRHTRIEPDGADSFVINLESLPNRVQCRELTFLLRIPATPITTQVLADGAQIPTTPSSSGTQFFTLPVRNGMKISMKPKQGTKK